MERGDSTSVAHPGGGDRWLRFGDFHFPSEARRSLGSSGVLIREHVDARSTLSDEEDAYIDDSFR